MPNGRKIAGREHHGRENDDAAQPHGRLEFRQSEQNCAADREFKAPFVSAVLRAMGLMSAAKPGDAG
jgi:hypothetical protein